MLGSAATARRWKMVMRAELEGAQVQMEIEAWMSCRGAATRTTQQEKQPLNYVTPPTCRGSRWSRA